MKFLTGSETMVPFGSPRQITVFFKHDCCNIRSNKQECKCYPTVSTCAFNLTLPTYITTDDLIKEVFVLALKQDQGFGRC